MVKSRVLRFREGLAGGRTLFGAWVTIADLTVAEMMSGAGFDYVVIDAEHSPWTIKDIQTALAGFATSETVVLVRIPSHDVTFVKHVLDVGVDGIICPLVRTAQEARELVDAAKYPPTGTRGYGPRRAADYGRRGDEYTAVANDEVIFIPQIEDAGYLDQVDAILDVPGLDALCVGPTDLSGSLGHLRQFDHPAVVEAVDTVLAKAAARDVAVCTGIVVHPEDVASWVAKGARLPLVTIDTALLVEGARDALERARSAAGAGDAG